MGEFLGQQSQGQFNAGPSLFDMATLLQSFGLNTEAIANRYHQLGLGGSTMQGQDETGASEMLNAAIGQEQNATVTNPAINTALQQPSQLPGQQIAAAGKLA